MIYKHDSARNTENAPLSIFLVATHCVSSVCTEQNGVKSRIRAIVYAIYAYGVCTRDYCLHRDKV